MNEQENLVEISQLEKNTIKKLTIKKIRNKMKTKFLLSITMLIMTFTGYTKNNNDVSMDSIRYAMIHPGTPIVISSRTISIYSPDWLHVTEYTEKQMVIYTGHNFSEPYTQTILGYTGFSWFFLLGIIVVGMVGSFLCMYVRGLFIMFPVISIVDTVRDNKNVYWWLPIILGILYVLVGWLGYYLKKQKLKNKEAQQ